MNENDLLIKCLKEEEQEKPIKKKRGRKKNVNKKIKSKFTYHPIMKSELDEKISYLDKRIYFSKDEDKKKQYKEQKERLLKRPIIKTL
jgi:hypothetical protein